MHSDVCAFPGAISVVGYGSPLSLLLQVALQTQPGTAALGTEQESRPLADLGQQVPHARQALGLGSLRRDLSFSSSQRLVVKGQTFPAFASRRTHAPSSLLRAAAEPALGPWCCLQRDVWPRGRLGRGLHLGEEG